MYQKKGTKKKGEVAVSWMWIVCNGFLLEQIINVQYEKMNQNVVDNITNGEVDTLRWAKELARSIDEEIITDLHCIDLGNLK